MAANREKAYLDEICRSTLVGEARCGRKRKGKGRRKRRTYVASTVVS
jgi:hypothetical protein